MPSQDWRRGYILSARHLCCLSASLDGFGVVSNGKLTSALFLQNRVGKTCEAIFADMFGHFGQFPAHSGALNRFTG